ncbi:MAG TPA: 30S ribosomal protein S12 methylthiotransferase RimO, partial [bacterium]|nr:30S ribosomal protein S12 methylthiotransferase RimO [bacterium]
MKKLFFESLGCPKNRVDSEVMIAALMNSGWVITEDPGEADLIILNTCSFIADARDESVSRFFELHASLKKGARIGVAGCLPQLYPDLKNVLNEADLVIGIDNIADISSIVEKGSSLKIKPSEFIYNSGME